MLHGLKRCNFNLKLLPKKSYPTPFMSSDGSLTYRIDALIRRYDSWKLIATKMVNFNGYYNVGHIMEMNPFVEMKIIQNKTGELVSTFRVPNTVAVMGQCEGIEGILELKGVLESKVNATLTFFRNIEGNGGNVHTETIFSQNRQAEINQNNVLLKWTVVVPMMKRNSFSYKQYSVRYYFKVLSFSYQIVIIHFGVFYD